MATDPGEKPAYWALDPRRCDTCRAAPALLFCAADSAFFCNTCDARVHAASRHPRVWICEVCEQAPASVTCKADAAVLCAACDADIHTANPLARRHERVPLAPFFDVASAAGRRPSGGADAVLDASEEAAAREAAASWLVLDPGPNLKGEVVDLNRNGNYFQDQDMDPYLDHHLEYASSMEAGFDCVVPIVHGKANVMKASPQMLSKDGGGVGLDFAPSKNSYSSYNVPEVGVVPDGKVKAPQMLLAMDAGGMDRDYAPIKQSYTGYSMSSSEVGVVPDGGGGGGMVDVTNPYNGGEGEAAGKAAAVAAGMDREARVMRYREKRKSRRFEKTIRYASRKAYAETRPRIKGRFAKRTEMEVEVGEMYLMDRGYGVVPSF